MTFGEELNIAENRARKLGRAEGRAEGIGIGIEQGIGIGNQQGEVRKANEVAMNMLNKGLEITFISEMTGLSLEEIQKLKTA